MADVSDQLHVYDVPTGRRLDTGEERDTVFEVGGLTPADEYRLKVARQHFIEARVEDFTQEGKHWVDRATGKRYNLVRFDPALSDDPAATGVALFYVADGRMVYLRPEGVESRSSTVIQGTVGEVVAP